MSEEQTPGSVVMTQEHQKFIELRAQGWTYVRIAQEIGVSKRTLINWSRKFQFDIQNQRELELEALRAQFVATREERVRTLGEQLQLVEAEIRKRDISEVPTARLFSLAAALRREILHDSASVKFTSAVNDIPADEYHEQVQDWSA